MFINRNPKEENKIIMDISFKIYELIKLSIVRKTADNLVMFYTSNLFDFHGTCVCACENVCLYMSEKLKSFNGNNQKLRILNCNLITDFSAFTMWHKWCTRVVLCYMYFCNFRFGNCHLFIFHRRIIILYLKK